MDQPSRYHPLLAALHWLLAVLIVAALGLGFFIVAATPNDDPRKVTELLLHMVTGELIVVLMAIRFVVRLRTSRPPRATTGYPWLDRLAPLAHYGFYVLILLLGASGLATAIAAGLPAIVFGGSGDPLPASFLIYPPRVAHGYLATLLVGLIVLHGLAALYHHFVRKDRLIERMSLSLTPRDRSFLAEQMRGPRDAGSPDLILPL
jgi:cytochrome b561